MGFAALNPSYAPGPTCDGRLRIAISARPCDSRLSENSDAVSKNKQACMKMAELSHFVNLDLVLISNSDFSRLIEHLDQNVFVLTHQEHGQQFLLVLEVSDIDCNDPGACTQQFLTLIESFSDAARELWDRCTSRTFSYRFEGGCKFPALDTTISVDLLRRIASVGADIGITVYPYRADDTADDKDRPKQKRK